MPGCEERLFCCSDVFYAMKEVETPGVTSEPWPPGDNGDACGPYQIHKGYWVDAFRLDQRSDYGKPTNPKPPAIPAAGECPSCNGEVQYIWLVDDALGGIPLSEAVICLYMGRHARNEKGRLQACRGTLADVKKVLRIHNGGPQGHTRDDTIPYWNKAKKILGC